MPIKNNEDFLEKLLVPGLGPEVYKMNLKQFFPKGKQGTYWRP